MAAKTHSNNEETAAVDAPAKRRLEAVAGLVADPAAGEGERLLYDRIRLGIMSALSVNRRMSFGELKELLDTSDGNLSKHARRLEDAGYLLCKKQFSDRVPRTEFRLTSKGKKMFARHLEHMESLIQATRPE
jgi:DNA-binding HxlR family transcriptional regulator